ncbi:methylated-DNA--[protein]-cysteine S-methyltransferase [Cellulomonas rhizosphaerae]|uniref:Methylated-DNA--protein-cysteine methyltransferase n=2 Tax=Cellulomonas rhizosphaerae TaxID=2293719 RepID=A0A413RQL4_9CELL|nr:methylated-DNA--[protein]-cysteine S-methyltransferase [Cellulomonas rhizosphaerae]
MTGDTLQDLTAGAGVTTHTLVPSPVGPVTLVATDGVLSKLLLPELDGSPARGSFGVAVDDGFGEASRQLAEYFAGIRTSFDLPLHLVGSPFQQRVWAGLIRIRYGETRSYGQLAADVGLDPRTASRAVGAANGRNPLAIIVPCHRVIGADGSLTGYAGGIERKRFLLDLEATRLF